MNNDSPLTGNQMIKPGDRKSLLITGGAGFLGYHLLNQILADEFRVRVLDLRPSPDFREAFPHIEFIVGDLIKPGVLDRVFADMDVVIHLVGEKKDPAKYIPVNVYGTQRVIEGALAAGIKHIIYVSTVGVVGKTNTLTVTEETTGVPVNEYERSKREAESLILKNVRERGAPVTILRPTNIFGDRDPLLHLLALILQVKHGRFRYAGDKLAELNYVYAGDVAEACVLAARTPNTCGQIYNVADPNSIGDFITFLSRELGGPEDFPVLPSALLFFGGILCDTVSRLLRRSLPLTVDKVRAARSKTIYSPEKLKLAFPFWPTFGWREGLRRTISWYRSQGLLKNS